MIGSACERFPYLAGQFPDTLAAVTGSGNVGNLSEPQPSSGLLGASEFPGVFLFVSRHRSTRYREDPDSLHSGQGLCRDEVVEILSDFIPQFSGIQRGNRQSHFGGHGACSRTKAIGGARRFFSPWRHFPHRAGLTPVVGVAGTLNR